MKTVKEWMDIWTAMGSSKDSEEHERRAEEMVKRIQDDAFEAGRYPTPTVWHREYCCEFTKPKTFELGEQVFWVRKCNGDRVACEINSPVRSDGRVVVEFWKTDNTPYRRTVYAEDLVKS